MLETANNDFYDIKYNINGAQHTACKPGTLLTVRFLSKQDIEINESCMGMPQQRFVMFLMMCWSYQHSNCLIWFTSSFTLLAELTCSRCPKHASRNCSIMEVQGTVVFLLTWLLLHLTMDMAFALVQLFISFLPVGSLGHMGFCLFILKHTPSHHHMSKCRDWYLCFCLASMLIHSLSWTTLVVCSIRTYH